ncbi:MAG: hypothetical protein K2Z81_12685, partial [Cyanobacteria bacterium]|nr:hypothetical protein [Cyanobacteriota bacterium]
MSKGNTLVKLGELLIRAGIMTETELEQAIHMAGDTGLPIGRVLIMSGWVTERELQSAVQAQSMVKDALVSIEMVIDAIKLVSKEEVSLEQALRQKGWTPKRSSST